MSHFYGLLRGSRGEATRCGTKNSGETAIVASWNGAIQTRVTHNSETGEDEFEVYQTTWHGAGIQKLLAKGIVGK